MTRTQTQSLLILVFAGTAGVSHAEESPYYLGGSLGLTHVSNIYRLPKAQAPNSDNVTTLSLLAGIDKPIGRQRLYADASVRRNNYRQDSSLNNTGYSLNAGLDWAALDKLSGSLSLRTNRSLATYNASSGVDLIRVKNIEQNRQVQLTSRYGLAGQFSLEGGLTHQQRDYSAAAYQVLEYKQDSVFAGLVYRPSSGLRFGVTGRYTNGDGFSRVAIFVLPNDYTRKNIDLTSTWTASAASTVSARLSVSKISNSTTTPRDYSGVTGQLGWQWRPTAKLQFNTTLIRDTVQEAYFNGGSNIGDVNRVGNSAQFNTTYELSSKIILDGGVNLSQTSREGLNNSSDDKLYGLSLGLRWLPTRNSQVSCQISRDKRNSDIVTYNYSANSYGCYGQLTLR